MSIVGSVLALVGIAARPRNGHYPVREFAPSKTVPVVDPRAKRIAELEGAVSRLTNENLHLQDAANAYAKQNAKDKARTERMAAELAERTAALHAAEATIEVMSRSHTRALDRLAAYEGRVADFTRPGQFRPAPFSRERDHLCCIPARHDFLTRGARSLAEQVERHLADAFLPRVASHAELNECAVINMDGTVRETLRPVLSRDEQSEMLREWNRLFGRGPEPPDAA